MTDNILACLCHVSWFLGFPILGPLILWLLFGAAYPLVRVQAKEALNFQISLLIYGLLLSGLTAIFAVHLLALIASLIALAALICTIIAVVATLGGSAYRYPFILRLIP